MDPAPGFETYRTGLECALSEQWSTEFNPTLVARGGGAVNDAAWDVYLDERVLLLPKRFMLLNSLMWKVIG